MSSYLLGALLVVYAVSVWVRAGHDTPTRPPAYPDPPPGIVRVVVDGTTRLVNVNRLGPDDRDEWDAAMRSVRRIANLHGTIE